VRSPFPHLPRESQQVSEWKKGKSYPRSRKPPGGRGQLFQGSSAESTTVDPEVEKVSFHRNIKYVAIPMSYTGSLGRIHTGGTEHTPRKHASTDP
jgi:hypothetical protein